MPSQGSQPLSQSSPLCLPLLKFSYATVSNDNIVPIPWIHLSSKNALFALFETSPLHLDDGRVEERQKFKVLKDPEIMEELDLNALSVEAQRVLAQEPAASSVNIPVVAVIVKVPMIAIKYPLANGQVRRFQIRFGKNEDYYEAMKMLARANVPTVEAGTFPSLKPQGAPRSAAPANLVAPNDSASQLGVETNAPRTYAGNTAISSVSGSRTAPTAPAPMAPPQMYAGSNNHSELRPSVQTPAIGLLQRATEADTRPPYPKSNISLSTATTLVPGKQGTRSHAIQSRFQDAEGNFARSEHISVQHIGDSAVTQLPRAVRLLQEVSYDLPPGRQEIPARSIEQEDGDLARPSRTTRNTSSRAQPGQRNEQPSEAEDPLIPKPISKGNGKRAATTTQKKPPAAKKPRASAPAKEKGKAAQKESGVPTVEELLRKPGYSLLPYDPSTTARTMPRSRQINRQEGFRQEKIQSTEVAESEYGSEPRDVGSPELGQVLPVRTTRSMSRALSYVPSEVLNRQPKDTGKSKMAPPPCTPADQIIGKPPTPASPAAPAYTSSQKAMGPPTGRNSSDIPTIDPSDVSGDPLLPLAQQFLAADEWFDASNAAKRLQKWEELPIPTQNTAMKHYFSELIMQDSFVNLVKNVQLHWEGAILEARVMRFGWPMAGVEMDRVDAASEEEEL